MKYGIIVAMNYELESLGIPYQTIEKSRQTYYLFNDDIVLIYSGIGKVNASYKTSLLINDFHPDHIINLGSAGCTNSNVALFDINIADKCQYGDVDVTCDPKYAINQIPYEPKWFFNDLQMINFLTKLLSEKNMHVICKTAITVDSFVTKNNVHLFHELANHEVGSVDMESCAIAQVCHHHQIPYNCIKIISDNIHHPINHTEFEMNMSKIAKISKTILLTILNSILTIHNTSTNKN